MQTLEALIDEQTRGDPESAPRWICKSTRSIAGELGEQDHPVSHMKVAQILHDLNYSLQGNRKTEEDADHSDRDARGTPVAVSCRPACSVDRPRTLAVFLSGATSITI